MFKPQAPGPSPHCSQPLLDSQMWPLKSHRLRKKILRLTGNLKHLPWAVNWSSNELERRDGAMLCWLPSLLRGKEKAVNMAAPWLPGLRWNIRILFQFFAETATKRTKHIRRKGLGNGKNVREGVWNLHSHLCSKSICAWAAFWLSFRYPIFPEPKGKSEHKYYWLACGTPHPNLWLNQAGYLSF